MPNSNSELYIIHAWEDNPIYLKCIQGESGIKIAKFQLVDDDGAIDLTGYTSVTFMGTKGDGTSFSVNCIVDDATNGRISLKTSTNFSNVIGNIVGNIVVGFSDNQNIQFDGIHIKVRPNKAIEALIQDDTFATFLDALARLQEISSGSVTEIDTALDVNSTHPVQNSAVATKFNEIIDNLDSYVKVVNTSGLTLDNCNQPNQWYKVYISSTNPNGWTGISGYHNVLCVTATNQITQYIFTQNGGVIFRTAPATNGNQSGVWGNFKEFAFKGTTLADYGITDAYTKKQIYNKSEVDTKLNNLSNTINNNKNKIANFESAIIDKMDKDFLSITSFMCDANGNIFAVTDDTVLTNKSFGNQDLTTEPYFIWIAHTVTEVKSDAFANTDKIAKIYCENTVENTPIPSSYRSLSIEYGHNALFAFYIMKSLANLLTTKANAEDVYSVENADNTFEKISRKVDSVEVIGMVKTEDHYNYPTIAALKNFLFHNFYTKTDIDNDIYDKNNIDDRFELQDTVGFDKNGIPVFVSQDTSFSAGSCLVNNIDTLFISSKVTTIESGSFVTNSKDIITVYIDNTEENVTIRSGALPDDVTIYYKGEFNVIGYIISALKKISENLVSQLKTKLDDTDNVIKTNHITDGIITEQKLSTEVKEKLNKQTAVYSYTIPASNWNNNVQTLTLPNSYVVTNNTKVDIEGDDTIIDQLVIDDCKGICVTNNNGTLTINAFDNAPTVNITVQLVVYEVENLN